MSKKINFIDLFAGAGGFGLGFQMAGYNPILSLEKDPSAYETLILNNNHRIIQEDITSFNSIDKIKKVISAEKIDVLIGGPPCQGFSVAASNRRKEKDSRNDLFQYFLRWVCIVSPKIFVIENVTGILTMNNSSGDKIIDIIEDLANKNGYTLSIWRLNAVNFGVPQKRSRVFIIGIKDKITILPPEFTHYCDKEELCENKKLIKPISVGEAILDLPVINAREGIEIGDYTITENLSSYQKWARSNSYKVYNHVAMKHSKRMIERYKLLIDGKSDLPNELKVRMRNGGGALSESNFNLNYRYLHPDLISYTIPASFYSSFIHPVQPRNITAREAARIQSFPDWYRFMGKRTLISNSLLKKQGKEKMIALSQYNQVGNAVPPLLAKAVAMRIKSLLL